MAVIMQEYFSDNIGFLQEQNQLKIQDKNIYY